MSKYAAKIEDGTVVQVIRGDADWATDRLGGVWVPSEDKVGQGWGYTKTYGLRPPKPYKSWTWDGAAWQAPVPQPDGNYVWDEDAGRWVVGETL